MIIDYKQNRDSIDISYVTADKQIAVETITFDGSLIEVEDENGKEVYTKEYHNFEECEESDVNKHLRLRSFYNKPIKLVSSKDFKNHNINYFLGYELPKFLPEVYEKLKPVIIPKLYSLDIETDITDEFGYSNQVDVENPIRSISITNENLDSILFIVKNAEHPDITETDMIIVKSHIEQALGERYSKLHEYKVNVKIFDTETEMLEAFINANLKYFHLIFGWNIYGYDLQYIFNRCEKLNIDYSRISPVRKTYKKRIEVNQNENFTINMPYHRVYIDYMLLFKNSLVYNNLGKYSLDYVSEVVLGLHKVMYSGNLRKLYETDYLKFVAYAYVDTILPMLLHHSVNLLNIDFFQSYYTGVPYIKIGQNAISDALVYKKLLQSNRFIVRSEFSQEEQRPYAGGYVKEPTDKVIPCVMGEDYNSLYPNSMVTIGISPEAIIDKINVDENGFPSDIISQEKWNRYSKLGFCLAPTGTVYNITEESLYTKIEQDLLYERKIYKSFMEDIYIRIRPALEAEIQSRK